MAKKEKKFKLTEIDAKDAPVKDIEWEGEELGTETKLGKDEGTGQPLIIRSFTFATNVESFKRYKPTAQELFMSHRMGIEALLWKDELSPYTAIEPRLIFSKDKSQYRFFITCLPKTLVDTPQTLTEILHGRR